jgi:ketosteroid isomerase-like protein
MTRVLLQRPGRFCNARQGTAQLEGEILRWVMSQEGSPGKREQVQTSTEALNAWNFEALAEVFHPELEHHSVFAAVEGEVYRGIEGQRKRWENVTATWDDFRIAVSEVHDVDDERVVVVLRLTGKAKGSGVPLDTLLGQVWTWRDGKVWLIVTHTDPREALEAVGLSVDAQSPS